MQSERRPHVVSTRLTESDSQTLQRWCDLTMRCPGDLLNTVLRRVFELRREHRSARNLEGFVHRLDLKPPGSNRRNQKPKAGDGSRALGKKARQTSRRAVASGRAK